MDFWKRMWNEILKLFVVFWNESKVFSFFFWLLGFQKSQRILLLRDFGCFMTVKGISSTMVFGMPSCIHAAMCNECFPKTKRSSNGQKQMQFEKGIFYVTIEVYEMFSNAFCGSLFLSFWCENLVFVWDEQYVYLASAKINIFDEKRARMCTATKEKELMPLFCGRMFRKNCICCSYIQCVELTHTKCVSRRYNIVWMNDLPFPYGLLQSETERAEKMAKIPCKSSITHRHRALQEPIYSFLASAYRGKIHYLKVLLTAFLFLFLFHR